MNVRFLSGTGTALVLMHSTFFIIKKYDKYKRNMQIASRLKYVIVGYGVMTAAVKFY